MYTKQYFTGNEMNVLIRHHTSKSCNLIDISKELPTDGRSSDCVAVIITNDNNWKEIILFTVISHNKISIQVKRKKLF